MPLLDECLITKQNYDKMLYCDSNSTKLCLIKTIYDLNAFILRFKSFSVHMKLQICSHSALLTKKHISTGKS